MEGVDVDADVDVGAAAPDKPEKERGVPKKVAFDTISNEAFQLAVAAHPSASGRVPVPPVLLGHAVQGVGAFTARLLVYTKEPEFADPVAGDTVTLVKVVPGNYQFDTDTYVFMSEAKADKRPKPGSMHICRLTVQVQLEQKTGSGGDSETRGDEEGAGEGAAEGKSDDGAAADRSADVAPKPKPAFAFRLITSGVEVELG